jgi:hypothetical protein
VTEYRSPVDIANRALQIVGASRIDDFDEDSKNAAECRFVYDKLRQAELTTNTWRFALRKSALRSIQSTSLLLSPRAWAATTTYQLGAVVSYDDALWLNRFPLNFNHTPGEGGQWEPFFGSLVVTPYDEDTSYYAGEFVYMPGTGDPALQDYLKVYTCLVNGIQTDPTDAQAYDATVTYNRGDLVTYGGDAYVSLISGNIAQTPASTYAPWAVGTTYALDALAIDIDTGRVYKSLANGNVGNALTDTTKWSLNTATPYFQPWLIWVNGQQNLQWSVLTTQGYDTQPISLLWPVSSGPFTADSTRSTYMLPHGFLKYAPQQPLIGRFPVLGGPMGNWPEDWELNGQFFLSSDVQVIVMRFGGNFAYVPHMNPLFCEMLAARMASELVQPLTQSSAKLADAVSIYSGKMALARTQNAIEVGPAVPPEDEYIAVRI